MRLLTVALLGHVPMAGNASAAVAALSYNLVVLALRTFLGATMTASAVASATTTNSACTFCNARAFAAVSTLADIVSSASQHAASAVCHSGINPARMTRASLTLVAFARLSPLLSADVSGPETFVIHAAGILSADRETLVRSKEAFLATISLHNSAFVTTRLDLAPASPWYSLTSCSTTPTSLSVCHFIYSLVIFF